MSGCTDYEFAVVKIAFWDGPARCDICPLLETYSRKQCRQTGEYLSDTRGRGHLCPLIMVDADTWHNFGILDEEEESGEYTKYSPI